MYLPCDTIPIFKQSLTGFISEFSFSKTGYLTKTSKPVLLYTHRWEKNNWILNFLKSISAM